MTKSPGVPAGSVVWQTRLSGDAAAVYERDIQALGLDRSEALRRGLRLLHREALEVQMAADVHNFYDGAPAPLSDVTAAAHGLRTGDQAGESVSPVRDGRDREK